MCKTSWKATSANRRRRRLPFQATPRSERSRTSPRLVCPSVRFAISQQDRFLSILRVSLLYSGRRARLSVLLCSVRRAKRPVRWKFLQQQGGTRSAGSEPFGDVSILFLFFSFLGTFHRCRVCARSVKSSSFLANLANLVDSVFKSSFHARTLCLRTETG